MWELTETCPDCRTPVWLPRGDYRCETCWRVVPWTVRDRRGVVRPDGSWGRLPPHLQGHVGLVRALAAAPVQRRR